MAITVNLLAEYSRVFPDLNEQIEELMKGIPREMLLKAGTSFLARQTMDHASSRLVDVLAFWIHPENESCFNEIIERVDKYYTKSERDGLNVLSPISSLRLIQLGIEKADDETIKDFKWIEMDMFKIYLLLNQSFTIQHAHSTEDIQHRYPDIYLGLVLLNMSFSTSELNNFIADREFFCQSVKAMLLADFIRKQEKLNKHLEQFLGRYGVKSMEEYNARVISILRSIINKEREGFLELTAGNLEDEEFIKRMSVQEYSQEDDIDFRIVRSSPLVGLRNKKFRVTHPLFCSDKLYKSIYFELSKINDLLGAEDKIPGFRTFFTTNFSEKYLLYEVLSYCFGDRYIQYTGEEIENKGVKGSVDYYIRNGKYIYLIENKDVLINGAVKEKQVFADIEEQLKEKFLQETNGRGVGIKQLIKNIEKVLQLANPFDKSYKTRNAVIFPILIVHDIVYDTPGLNSLFNVWFQHELEALKAKGLNVANVKPLIVLNIDTLIRSAELLRKRKIDFSDLLEVYYKSIVVTKKNFKTQQHLENEITKVYLPSTTIIEDWLLKNQVNFVKENRILEFAFNKMKS